MTGVSKAEFWTLTPLEILAQLEHRRAERAWWSSRFAVLISSSGVRRSESGLLLGPRDIMEDFFND